MSEPDELAHKISRFEQAERKLLLEALEMHGWCQARAAEWLRVSLRVVNYKVVKYQLKHPSWIRNRP